MLEYFFLLFSIYVFFPGEASRFIFFILIIDQKTVSVQVLQTECPQFRTVSCSANNVSKDPSAKEL
ncbi:MAG: hypothetical protein D3909_10630 [Candidatus Electrothrix sp. ATG1]|nr:hypothetical protein [Candidatus Electrothrix sp. ATG1]